MTTYDHSTHPYPLPTGREVYLYSAIIQYLTIVIIFHPIMPLIRRWADKNKKTRKITPIPDIIVISCN
jgi:hypothetical protein